MATKTKTSKPAETAGSETQAQRRSSGPSISRVTVIGRLVSDPVMRYTPNGTAVANFRIAVNNGDESTFQDVVVWRKLAEISSAYLSKGRLVYVDGSLKGRTWTGRDGQKRYTLDIIASQVRFLSPRPRPAGAGAVETAAAA